MNERERVEKKRNKSTLLGPITMSSPKNDPITTKACHSFHLLPSLSLSNSSSIPLTPILHKFTIPLSHHHHVRRRLRPSLLLRSPPPTAIHISAAATEPVRVAETARLEHVRTIPKKPVAASRHVAVQLQPRPRFPPVSGSVRKNQGALARLHLFRAARPARPVHLPAPAGVGQPRRAHRPAPGSLRGTRWLAGDEPVRERRN